ncbi:YeaC family protein [Marinobacter sp.]|uniref:YeaC family protein n=1 Tax=Marinobacter sp. TaxID=50741 RepID=UPI0038510CB0
MTYEELIERLDPAVYSSLKRGIELGKWPDGRKLSPEQRAICMEAVLFYENRHNVPKEQRVGYIQPRTSDTTPIRILN